MILLDSVQILEAVSRSLDAFVLPKLADDFARVQVLAARKALQEVCDRLVRGDPCETINAETIAGVRAIAAAARERSPAFAAGLLRALAGVAADADARERNRQLGEALWVLVAGSDDEAARQVLALLHEQSIKMMRGDGVYICGEAIASLT